MSINGDVLVKIAAGLKVPAPVPKDILKNDFPGLGAGPIIDYPYDRNPRINDIPMPDFPYDDPRINDIPMPDFPYDDPRIKNIPMPDFPYDDPRIKNIPRIDRPVNIPKGEPERTSRAGDIGRAAGRAARTVRDGAVDTAREVGRSVSDAVRGFGQGWRGGR